MLTPQTSFYLMVRTKVEDALDWDTGRMSITWMPRKAIKEDEELPAPTREGLWRQVTRNHLDLFEIELKAAHRRATSKNWLPSPGPHCKYCPSKSICPEAFE